MPIRLAILGLDLLQRDWLTAAGAMRDAGEVEIVGIGDRSLAAARDVVDFFKGKGREAIPAYDDLRLLLKERVPQVLLMDRPPNANLDFLQGALAAGIGIFSLGPPIETLAEAQTLAGHLPAQTHLLYTWPRFADAPVFKHCAQADEYVRPIRFAQAAWLGVNHALAKTMDVKDAPSEMPVRSLSVLAWDALGTLIRLMQLPTSVYAAVRGTVSPGNSFADLTGAASLTLRFEEDVAASVTLCDRVAAHRVENGWRSRDVLLWGNGTVRLSGREYEFRDAEGKLVDAGAARDVESPVMEATRLLRQFVLHYGMPPSPHRGWTHSLEEIAATMEALIVSHRTGQAESPEKFRKLRR